MQEHLYFACVGGSDILYLTPSWTVLSPDENRAPGELECAGPLLYTRVSVLQRAPVMHVRHCDDSVLLDRDWSQPSFWDLAPRVLLLLMISVQIEGVL